MLPKQSDMHTGCPLTTQHPFLARSRSKAAGQLVWKGNVTHMDTLYDVIEHLLLAATRDGEPEPAITASQVARASGETLRDVCTYLDALVKQGALQRAAYRLAPCPQCQMPLRVPAPVMVGWEAAAPPLLLRLTAAWCPTCQQMLPSGGLRPESAYVRPAAVSGTGR